MAHEECVKLHWLVWFEFVKEMHSNCKVEYRNTRSASIKGKYFIPRKCFVHKI